MAPHQFSVGRDEPSRRDAVQNSRLRKTTSQTKRRTCRGSICQRGDRLQTSNSALQSLTEVLADCVGEGIETGQSAGGASRVRDRLRYGCLVSKPLKSHLKSHRDKPPPRIFSTECPLVRLSIFACCDFVVPLPQ